MGAAHAVRLSTIGTVATVAVTGPLDLATAPQLERAFSGALELSDEWVIDLRAVDFLDSSGLRALLRARRDAMSRGGTLRIRPGSEAVMGVLVVADVLHLFTSTDRDPGHGP